MNKKVVYMNKKITSILTCVLLITTMFTIATSSVLANDWPMVSHNAGRTGFSSSKVPYTDNLLWIYQNDMGYYFSPIMGNGKLFFYIGNNTMGYSTQCIDAMTGELIWNYPKGNYKGSPTFYENKVFIGDDATNSLCCLDAEGNGDGTTDELWSSGELVSYPWSPVIADGYLYMWGAYCFDADPSDDGIDEGFDDPDDAEYDLVWHYTFDDFALNPSVANGNVYYSSMDFIYCLDATGNGDGTTDLIWEFELYESDGSALVAPVLYDNKVYFSRSKVDTDQKTGLLYCIDALGNGDGTTDVLWTYTTDYNVYKPVVANGKVFVPMRNNVKESLVCLDAIGNYDGTTNFIWATQRGGLTSPVVADGKVLACSLDNRVYCFDEDTGENIIWTYADENEIEILMSPIVYEINGSGFALLVFENGYHLLGGNAPDTPTIYKGTKQADIDEKCFFDVISKDPQGFDISYLFDWDDGTETEWTDPMESGMIHTESHTWNESGTYQVRVKARNTDMVESNWSEPFSVTITALSIRINGGFGLTVQIRNDGPITKKINYDITLSGGIFFNKTKTYEDTNVVISPEDQVLIRTGPFFHLGALDIAITVESSGDPVLTKNLEGYVFFFYVMLE